MLEDKDMNRDPLTDAPGAHPIGTGIGAAGGALTGMAAGAIGGPITVAVGGVAGAITGGLAGKAIAESVNPTAEEAYWRESYTREPYYESGRTFDDYAPAYALGWSSRGRTGDDDFESAEASLASSWDAQRGASKLSWSQARHATRAAWDRVDQTVARKSIDNDDVIDTLNDLIETCRDGEYGFGACAEHTQGLSLKALFLQCEAQCSDAAAELQRHVVRLGGKPDSGGSASGALHRGWVAVRGTLSGYSDKAMLDECERGEDTALARYRKALKQELPGDVREVVERQRQGAQKNHDQIKALRDEARSHA